MRIPLLSSALAELCQEVGAARRQLDRVALLQGRALTLEIAHRGPLADIREAEFAVYSQFGEDGIVQYLLRAAGVPPAACSFVEFGVEDYVEANTRFLLVNDNWRGLVIDGGAENVERIRRDPISWRHDLTALHAFIDRDNVDELIGGAGFTGEIGLLSIDLDGNDYWIWERLGVVDPIVVIVEYNSVFGSEHAVTVPYRHNFARGAAHWSHLYWGASLPALCSLAEQKGYAFVGANSNGNDAFFVRSDRVGALRPLTAAEGYVESRFRDSRDEAGNLSHVGGAARRELIADLPLRDVAGGRDVTLRELGQRP